MVNLDLLKEKGYKKVALACLLSGSLLLSTACGTVVGEGSVVSATATLASTQSTIETSPVVENTQESTDPASPAATESASVEPSETQTPDPLVPADTDKTYRIENGACIDKASGRTLASMNGEPIKVRAIYMSGSMAGYKPDYYINLVNTTELNALVIDIKDDGLVNYETMAEPCHEMKLYKKNFKVDELLKKCHDNGIYVIGRIVVFRDNPLAQAIPAYAVKRPDGGLWLENRNKDGAWTNPSVTGVLDYNIAIAKEAVERGFDEIQFDYVRFPTVPKSNPAAYAADMPDKIDVIDQFLKRANDEIKAVRQVPVSADVFGIIAESVSDGKAIGQQLEMVGQNIDYLSPMVYPSHFANAGKGVVMGNGVGQQINGVLFTAPDLKPYDVVLQALLKTRKRIEATPTYRADIRAYLQDFTAGYIKNKNYYQEYGPKQLREQIQAVYDAGYFEWILWNGRNIYSESGLLSEADAIKEADTTTSAAVK